MLLAKPKFYENIDNSHCAQTCLKSLFSVLLPERKFDWEELEQMTGYVPGHGAWIYAELLAMKRLGLEARLHTGFDCQRFIAEGFGYIESEFGTEVAEYERQHPHDYEKIQKQISQSLNQGLIIQKPGTREDIMSYIDAGWHVMLLVNSKALNGQKGYEGHRILVYGYDAQTITFHDPGPNHAQAGRQVDWEALERAWAYPDDRLKEMMVVRRVTR